MKMRHVLILAAAVLAPLPLSASCGANCDATYADDVQSCQQLYGDDPTDADDLTQCIQNARDDYGSCLDDCRP